VCAEGDVLELDADVDLPGGDFGRDWAVVEAPSAAVALERAKEIDEDVSDAWDLLASIVRTREGWPIDRLVWHVYEQRWARERVDGNEVTAIRWGAPHTDGHSYDYARAHREPGVSAVAATCGVDGLWRLDDGPGVLEGTLTFLVMRGAIPYLVRGIVVGHDSDGGLSLRAVRRVARLVWTDGGLVTR